MLGSDFLHKNKTSSYKKCFEHGFVSDIWGVEIKKKMDYL